MSQISERYAARSGKILATSLADRFRIVAYPSTSHLLRIKFHIFEPLFCTTTLDRFRCALMSPIRNLQLIHFTPSPPTFLADSGQLIRAFQALCPV